MALTRVRLGFAQKSGIAVTIPWNHGERKIAYGKQPREGSAYPEKFKVCPACYSSRKSAPGVDFYAAFRIVAFLRYRARELAIPIGPHLLSKF